MTKNWIQKVTKHKGNLKKWAKEHHFTNKNGTINISKGLMLSPLMRIPGDAKN